MCIRDRGIEYKEVENLDEAMPELDILYMTRVQRERFFNEEDYILSLIHIWLNVDRLIFKRVGIRLKRKGFVIPVQISAVTFVI